MTIEGSFIMMWKSWVAAGTVALVASIAAPAHAKWVELQCRTIDRDTTREVFPVSDLSHWYRTIELTVQKNGVEIEDLDVTFGNGNHEEYRVRRMLSPGQSTRELELLNAPRRLDQIEVSFGDFLAGDRRPEVCVNAFLVGETAPGEGRPQPPGKPDSGNDDPVSRACRTGARELGFHVDSIRPPERAQDSVGGMSARMRVRKDGHEMRLTCRHFRQNDVTMYSIGQ